MLKSISLDIFCRMNTGVYNFMDIAFETEELNELLHEFLNIGEMMLRAGAEIKRVEDTIMRMGIAYGATKMNVFVITSSIVVTMAFSDGRKITQTRRIMEESGTDFKKLEALNELSRTCCEKILSINELKKEIEYLNKESSESQILLGSVLASGSFAIFFGGTVWDGVCAAAFGLFICFLQKKLKPICPNNVIFNLLCSFLTGVGICLFAKWCTFVHADKIMI